MTITVITAVRDRAVDAYMHPIFTATVGQAIRMFADAINTPDEKSTLYKHPDDYDLYQLGTYDEKLGQFQNLQQPTQVAIGKQLKIRE